MRRDGDHLYIHGANNSRLMEAVLSGQCAVSITHLDGLVLARSALRHSMNYRSVVVYGQFTEVVDTEEKLAAMAAFVEHVAPGRTALVRPPSPAEAAGTQLARMPLAEAAAKVRSWGVEDAEADLGIPVWAGVVPLALRAGPAQPESGCGGHNPPRVPSFLVD